MFQRLLNIFYLGLFLVTAGVLGLALYLNHRHHSAALLSVGAAFERDLGEQAQILQERIRDVEQEMFALFDDPHRLAHECEVEDLFLLADLAVIPACLEGVWADPLEEVAYDVGRKAFDRGLDAMRSGEREQAIQHFEIAGKLFPASEDELYLKISAWLNVLELRDWNDLPTLFGALYLLDEKKDPSLSRSQKAFFDSLLREHVAEYDRVKARSRELWAKARVIEREAFGRSAPFRMLAGTSVLTVDPFGRGYLFPEGWERGLAVQSPVRFSSGEPDAGSAFAARDLEVWPSAVLWISQEDFLARKEAIQKAYRLGGVMIGLMLVLSCGLVAGIILTMRKEKELGAMRAGFIATASHELRTPLSLIRLYAETLYRGRIGKERLRDYYQTILVESERMTGLVNNVLDFSRLERGQYRIHLDRTNLSEICDKIAESFRFRLDKEGFVFEKRVEPEIIAPADTLAFSQVVFNLMDNAVKYSGDRKEIEMVLKRDDGNAVLWIKDHGLGIPDHLKKKVFEEFVRVSDKRVSAQRGSGIGLNVTRKLLTRMGGTVEVHDNRPKGSIFKVILPIREEKTA